MEKFGSIRLRTWTKVDVMWAKAQDGIFIFIFSKNPLWDCITSFCRSSLCFLS